MPTISKHLKNYSTSEEGILVFAPELMLESDYMRSDRYQILKQYEDFYFWFKSRRNLIIFIFQNYLKNVTNFCEIGCGGGYILENLHRVFPEISFSGSEIHLEGLKVAKERVPTANFFQADVLDFPYEEEFDGIGAFDVIEHIENDVLALENIHKALTPGGRVILSVPQHKWLWSQKDDYSGHQRRYTFSELVLKLQNSGFKVLKRQSFMSLLLPIMYLSSKRYRNSEQQEVDKNIDKEFEIPKMVNQLFLTICQFELLFNKMGITFPFGGSLFVIAEKI